MDPMRALSDSELAAAEGELRRRERQRRLEGSAQLGDLEANSRAVVQLQTRLDEARAHRARLIEVALKAGHSRFEVADAAGITIRRLDAIRSRPPPARG